jgi:inosine-uridine nucleoside N-ribohydrolase
MRHMLIDTDTASDDAVALVMALKSPENLVEAITIVAGNVPVDQAVQNALYTVELCGSTVPVYKGMASPMLRPLETAQDVHGRDGMGDIDLPLSGRTPAEGHAVDIIEQTIRRHAHDITLVTLGPLTNVALALLRDPSLAAMVKECVIMGGVGRGPGNITPVAEFNIWVDPEAAKIVFASGLPITMVGWDISVAYATFAPKDAQAVRDVGTPLAQFCIDIQRVVQQFSVETTKLAGFDLPDPIAMSVALDPSVKTLTKRLFVAIETQSDLCRGQAVVDHLGVTNKAANAEVVLEASRERFLDCLYGAVSK